MTKPAHSPAATKAQMNLRIAVNDRLLFDLAADALGTSRSEFMLNASRKMAETTLMNRALFLVDTPTWDAFVAQLDNATPDQAGLDKLKSAALPWKN